jgi:hypothetical protein
MRIRARDEVLAGAIVAVDVVPRDADVDARPEAVPDASGPPPGVLDVSIRRRGKVVELRLAGALDTASAPRLGEAMELAREMATQRAGHPPAARAGRRSRRATILIDTRDIEDVDSSGYGALQEALVGPNGLWDRGVDWIVGPAVATFEGSIGAAPAPRARDGGDHRRGAPGHEPSRPPGP